MLERITSLSRSKEDARREIGALLERRMTNAGRGTMILAVGTELKRQAALLKELSGYVDRNTTMQVIAALEVEHTNNLVEIALKSPADTSAVILGVEMGKLIWEATGEEWIEDNIEYLGDLWANLIPRM